MIKKHLKWQRLELSLRLFLFLDYYFASSPFKNGENGLNDPGDKGCLSNAGVEKGNNLPGNDEQDAAHAQVGQQDVDPDVRSHGVQEGEEAVFGGVGFAVQDADAGVHEGFGEVDGLFSHVGDGERSHSQVCSL